MLSLSFHALLPVAPIILRDILVVSYGNSSKTARCELALPITFRTWANHFRAIQQL